MTGTMTKKNLVLSGFIIAKIIIQYLLIDPVYDLHRDEYLHLDQANHLAWGYLSVPPVTSWISYIISLLGNSVFWVKFFPALFGAFTIAIAWKIIEELNGSLFAMILGATSVLLSSLLRINILYQPNSLDIMLWTAFYFVVIKYIGSENNKWLYYASIVFAIAFLNKYNFVFLLSGLLPAILLTEHRKIFLNKHFYFAILSGLFLILPNLVWQFKNNFPVIHHLDELARTQLVNIKRTDFFKEQLLFFIGSVFVLISAIVALLIYKPFRKYRLFLFSFIITLFIYAYLKAKAYYAIGLYPVLIAIGSAYLGFILKNGWKKYLQPVALAIPVIISIPIFGIAFPNRSPEEIEKNPSVYKKLGLLRWEDGKDHTLPQDFADMLGWKELALKVDSIYAAIPAQEKTLILCDNYGEAGAINYYSKIKKITALSFNADYINWFNLDNRFENLIRIKEYKNRDTELKETAPFFDSSQIADSVINPFAREYGTTIFVFRNARVDINTRIKEEIDNIKNNKE